MGGEVLHKANHHCGQKLAQEDKSVENAQDAPAEIVGCYAAEPGRPIGYRQSHTYTDEQVATQNMPQDLGH